MIFVIDTETTGLDPVTADIVELAVVTVPNMYSFSSLVHPTVPIELKAMAAHHIKEKWVEKAPHIKSVFGNAHLDEAKFLVAHNAEFDRGFIEKPHLLPEIPWVCTWRCARHIWPEAPGFSNQVLRYYLDGLDDEIHLEVTGEMIMALPPHRALPDAWITAHILRRMLIDHTIEELVELTKKPILGTTVPFGMHRDLTWGKVPKSYLRWIMKEDEKAKKKNEPGFDSDTIYTVKHWLEYCPHCSNGCKKCNMTGFKYPLVAEEIV